MYYPHWGFLPTKTAGLCPDITIYLRCILRYLWCLLLVILQPRLLWVDWLANCGVHVSGFLVIFSHPLYLSSIWTDFVLLLLIHSTSKLQPCSSSMFSEISMCHPCVCNPCLFLDSQITNFPYFVIICCHLVPWGTQTAPPGFFIVTLYHGRLFLYLRPPSRSLVLWCCFLHLFLEWIFSVVGG